MEDSRRRASLHLFLLLLYSLLSFGSAPLVAAFGPIKMIVVLVMEKRSFNHMLGWMKRLNPPRSTASRGWNGTSEPPLCPFLSLCISLLPLVEAHLRTLYLRTQISQNDVNLNYLDKRSLNVICKTKRTKKAGIVGKYGTRYGASLHKQIKKMEVSQHAKYFCEFCGKVRLE
ncbi:hypothetical protein Cni_G13574 [Canna indica]|uniref:Uncharacterized protein n=1 Tax=Canna indica TaxID=4628 RepID=A0AAQ3KA49_9LILI|nr:hypothetical protein Cni_G13574 [Canna indica]